jgi:formate dehydrogenase major subunit
MGSNMAEAHPVGFRFPMKARANGARLIHVDPHFSRTSASATDYVPIRAGTDIVFLGGIINQILTQERWFREYVLAYTNATTVISDAYVDAEEECSGIFSGYHADDRAYNLHEAHWHYADDAEPARTQTPVHVGAMSRSETLGDVAQERPRRDLTLQDPNCVLNILRRHYARYTPRMVADQCGCTEEQFLGVAEQLMANSGRERTSAVVYAVGWTQHSTGVQMIRAAGVMQLLLGNMGRPGGGIMAMRGHASIQGSTDIPTLYNLLPGYIPQPATVRDHNSLPDYLAQERVEHGVWSGFPAFVVSLLKAWYGDGATAENDWGFGWLPRITADHSQLPYAMEMAAGKVRGFFLMGQNPAAGSPNANLNRLALRQLDWLVVRDFFAIESATFWKEGPDQPDPATIATEVFFMPAASGIEKSGTLTNTERMLQWHDQAIDPPGDCRSELWFAWNLGRRMKRLYAESTNACDQGIRNLTWEYGHDGAHLLPDGRVSLTADEPDAAKVLREINGYTVADHTQLERYQQLKDDGSTACGCWIYCGVYPEAGRNRASERTGDLDQHAHLNWGWAWPGNRRMLYNRASADPDGNPWSERKKYVWWDKEQQCWTGLDTPDFEPTKPPDYRPPKNATGMDAIAGDSPFILKPDGKGWLFAPGGVKDGPLPTHYEPVESPVPNALYAQQSNPTVLLDQVPLNSLAAPEDPDYPIVATTYRLTEHYLSGPMSRFDSWLNELQPEMFVEISPDLAAARGIVHGEWVIVTSKRGAIEARAMVTPRLHSLRIQGRTVHQIGLPIHFGWAGEVAGSQANDLTAILSDANVSMHEGKAFTCQVHAGRLAVRSDLTSTAVAPRPQSAPMADTNHQAQPEGRTA